MSLLLKILLSLLGIYLLICFLLYHNQERFIFYPEKLDDDYPFNEFDDVEEVYFPVDDQCRLHALHFKVDQPKGIVLYFHGNARAVNDWGYAAADFTRRNYEVFMPDYRGYGKSTGPRSEKAFFTDAKMFYDSLRQKYPADQIIIYGRSLGSGVACQLATQVEAKMVLLETPYLSLVAMAHESLPYFPANLLMRFQFRNDLNISKVKMPIYLFHGTKDELIPYKQAVQLQNQYGKEILTTIEDAGHNNLSEFASFQNKLDELLVY
jgi:Lysophospholipase